MADGGGISLEGDGGYVINAECYTTAILRVGGRLKQASPYGETGQLAPASFRFRFLAKGGREAQDMIINEILPLFAGD